MKNTIVQIPWHELEITASRSGGSGGQHVNRSDTRITMRWNIPTSNFLSEEQKALLLQKLGPQLTRDGDIIIHNSVSRSQEQNKKMAYKTLLEKIDKALKIPKKRMKTRVPYSAIKARLEGKTRRSVIKKSRSNKIADD